MGRTSLLHSALHELAENIRDAGIRDKFSPSDWDIVKVAAEQLRAKTTAAERLSLPPFSLDRRGIDFELAVDGRVVHTVPVPYKVLGENGISPWAPSAKWPLPTQRPDGSWVEGAVFQQTSVSLNPNWIGHHDAPGLYMSQRPFVWWNEAPAFRDPDTNKPVPLQIFGVNIYRGNPWRWINPEGWRGWGGTEDTRFNYSARQASLTHVASLKEQELLSKRSWSTT
jgi:hypothetical protein